MATIAIPLTKIKFARPKMPPVGQWIDFVSGIGVGAETVDVYNYMAKHGFSATAVAWQTIWLIVLWVLYWRRRWKDVTPIGEFPLKHSEGRKERMVSGLVSGVVLGIFSYLFADWALTAVLFVWIAEAIIWFKRGGTDDGEAT